MKAFDLNAAPLQGVNLIEAGAGTGKTYTIAGLYVRLVVEKKLGVDQILVVTYTKAATEELKSRIRGRLAAIKHMLTAAEPVDVLFDHLLSVAGDEKVLLERVNSALLNFDRAAIFTIHGFCQRLLQNFAFETGALFKSDMIQDQSPLVGEAVDDFWRRYISGAPVEFARYVLDKLKSPDNLAALVNRSTFPGVRILPAEKKPLLNRIRPWRNLAGQVLNAWPRVRSDVCGLLQSPALNARSYGKCDGSAKPGGQTPRQAKVEALAAAMDRWAGSYPLFKKFDHFCAGFIRKATLKGKKSPEHPFFDLCGQALATHDAMAGQFSDYLRYLKVKLFNRVWTDLRDKKSSRNQLYFDDLLLHVHRALNRADAMRTIGALQRQFQAALVDEFQDTDSLQYEIFVKLFSGRQSVFFMIGDPKQAIYSFRGADLFSYIQAAEAVDLRYTLTRNWRSTPALIQAVNTIFANHKRPFGLEKIVFEQATAAWPEEEGQKPALFLWYLLKPDGTNVSGQYSQQEALPLIAAATAGQIVKLLDGRTEAIAPEQIAVLTRSHHQARLVKKALAERAVPAVLYSAGSVFETPEAFQLGVVLKAAAEPTNAVRVRAALASDLLGARAHDFLTIESGVPAQWEARWAHFAHYHEIWNTFGFYNMFSRMVQQEEIKARLLCADDGERRLTNLLHLAELLHQASVEHKLGPEALIKWLQSQLLSPSGSEDARQLRLDSDDHAVRILTIHKCKGLQFEYVFCPFTWSGAKVDDASVRFHDPDAGDRLSLAIGPDIDPEYKRHALEEELAENIRLLYVALTRARKRCYWVWGRINKTELSSPAYLLHAGGRVGDHPDWIAALQNTMAELDSAGFLEDLNALALRSGGTIAVSPLPTASGTRLTTVLRKTQARHCRQFTRGLDSQWRIASFSALAADSRQTDKQDSEAPDRDAGPVVVETLEIQAGTQSVDTIPLAAFPRGVRPGLFFHDLLENLDFKDCSASLQRGLIAEKLASYDLDDAWEGPVASVLEELVQLNLPGGGSSPTFSRISLSDRINELDFHFPLRRVTPQELRSVFKNHDSGKGPAFKTALDRLGFEPVHGFLKGFIDLVFRWEGRYYLVDWKSNFLGASYSDYAADRLSQVMYESFYFLQYHFYTVALDQWLRCNLQSYAYNSHFGGVYYIFLRGIRQERAGTTGIFYDLPAENLIADLRRLMVAHPNG